ncbi:MAG TPA: hypothetical protein VF746_16740 [Longimicrobium sp.]|jgi:hypothetical protein
MLTRCRAAVGALALAILTTACADLPSAPDSARIDAAQTQVTPASPGRLQSFVCITRLARPGEPSTWSAAVTRVRFSASELDPEGRTTAYRYRGYTPGDQIVAAVDCVIPATDAAVARMNRWLDVDRWHRLGSTPGNPGVRLSMGSARFEEVESSETALAPVVATGQWCGPNQIGTYPECYPITSGTPPIDEPTTDPYSDWTWWGGVDTETEPDDGTGRDPCQRNAEKVCVTREVEPDEWTKLLERIEQIKDHPAECAGAKQALRGLAARGRESQRLRFWDGYDVTTDPATGERSQRFGQTMKDAQGPYIEYDSHWVWNEPSLLVHEGLHLYFFQNPHPTLTNDEDLHKYIHSIDQDCV